MTVPNLFISKFTVKRSRLVQKETIHLENTFDPEVDLVGFALSVRVW